MDIKSEARTILVLNGAVGRRSSYASVLRQLGHRVIEGSSGKLALLQIVSEGVDLVVSDLLLPDMNGSGLCQAIRSSSRNALLPVILINRRGYLNEEVQAIDAGADAVLPFGVHPRALCAAVQSCLRRKAAMEALDETETVLFTLAQSVEERDPALGRHCERLAQMCETVAVELGMSGNDIVTLQRGAVLHDVGKVGIPDSVLFKPGPLNDEEWEIMKSHAARGERICRNVRSLAPVLPIIRSHHERWDGTGYPDGLKGEQIPLLARIVQLADIHDALTTARPYKRAMKSEDAVRIMEEETAKGWRDPRLMQVFTRLVPRFLAADSPDLAQTSLQALAKAVEQQRTGPAAISTMPARVLSGV